MKDSTNVNGMLYEAFYSSEGEFHPVILKDGEFVYKECPILWAEFEISFAGGGVQLVAQFDCSDVWCWYNSGGDGESSEYTALTYLKSEEPALIEWLDDLLKESTPDNMISLTDKAECLRADASLYKTIESNAKAINEIVPERCESWALVLAYYIRDGIADIGAYECQLQINYDLSKDQTLAITSL